MSIWGGRKVQEARRWCMTNLGWVCGICHHPITDPSDYTVGHIVDRAIRPDLTWVKSNWRPEHGRKHPDLGCPGNFGRSSRRRRRTQRVTPLPGW